MRFATVGRSGVFDGAGGGSGFESSGGAVRSQWIQPHCMSVHLLRFIACKITATLAAHSRGGIPRIVLSDGQHVVPSSECA